MVILFYKFAVDQSGENPQKIDEIRKEIERIKELQYLEKKKKREEKEKREVDKSILFFTPFFRKNIIWRNTKEAKENKSQIYRQMIKIKFQSLHILY